VPSAGPYLRFPSIRGDLLAFVADDDVWLVPSGGGTSRRLSADRAPVSHPALSPDGSLVAFTSTRDGTPEVFVVGTDGEGFLRLSYFGDEFTRTIGWTEDGRVLAVSATAEPFRSRTWAYALSVDGARVERLPYGPVSAVAHGPGGAVVLGVNQSSRRGAAWKRYRGGTAAALWIDARGSGEFVPYLRNLDGQLEDPAFVGDRVTFVSDHEGYGNVYSARTDGTDVRRHTDHADFYARGASSDGRAVVYQCAGDLWRLDALTPDSSPHRLDISLGAPRGGRARRALRAEEVLGEHAVDHDGRASAVEARGEIHWLTHRLGPARLVAGGAGVRARLPRVRGTGPAATVVLVSDAAGEDAIEVVPALGEVGQGDASERRRIGAGEIGRVLDLEASPDGRHAAVATHDGRVLLARLDDGAIRTVSVSVAGDASGLAFSPDSRYLAWSEAGPEPLRHIRLARVDADEVIDVTPLRFVDEEPVFSHDGKYLAFLSVRTFDPLYDAQVFDLSFAQGARPHLVPLAAATPSPFDAEVAGRPRPGSQHKEHRGGHGGEGEGDGPSDGPHPAVEGGAETAGAARGGGPASDGPDAREAAPAVEVDVDGLAERVVPFPVAAGRYARLRATATGFLWIDEPLNGVLGEGRAGRDAQPTRPALVGYDLAALRQVHLVDGLDGYDVSGDGTTVVVRDGTQLRAMPAERKPTPPDPTGEPDPDVVEIDLRRLRVEVDPPVEWTQMYDEAARLMRDHFWVEDMAGVDWAGAVGRYRPLLERIATRDDLSDVLWEVQGELGSSHAYERPPARPVEEERRLGLLGADLVREEDGTWRVGRIVPGESSVLGARSPLHAPGVGVRRGDVVLAVDGRPVDPVFGPAAGLVGAAGKPVQLTVRDRSGTVREVVVEPLGDQRTLRYHAWVADRRVYVHDATGGRVGYVHVPDMMGTGWAELHRDLRMEVAREGLVVDVRDNGGGHVSPLVLETIGRTVGGWDVVRHMSPLPYPPHAPRGPRVLVTNEQAGSDGDIVTAGFRQRGLGPVVGTRTWGGVIGIDGRYHLVDGTLVTQPRYSFWFYGLGWDVENHGVDPDVEVPLPPQDWGAGRDPQLDRAIELVLAALDEHPAATPPDPATRPDRAAPRLPPRT
jgi:tricorn protease